MKEILETVHLEYDKSSFLIDLIKSDSGLLYLEISQIIQNTKQIHKIKLKPAILSDVIKTLQEFQTKLPTSKVKESPHVSEEDKKKLQDRYLKGVSIKDLAIQFDQKESFIETILRNKGIKIVPNEVPKRIYYKRRQRK